MTIIVLLKGYYSSDYSSIGMTDIIELTDDVGEKWYSGGHCYSYSLLVASEANDIDDWLFWNDSIQ